MRWFIKTEVFTKETLKLKAEERKVFLKKHKEVCYNDGVWSTKQKDDNERINRTEETRD